MKTSDNKIIIAVDGYSSCGKSTFAKAIAKKINYTYIDSGAMYRAVTFACLENGFIKDSIVDEEKLEDILMSLIIEFRFNKEKNSHETYLNGKNIENEIRDIAVSKNVSPVSVIKNVREKLVDLQRKMGNNKAVVMDGRDIGTTVFPNAELKIFMIADVDIRAERRYKELIEKGITTNIEEIKDNIANRDYIDSNREISPLRKADDAIELDNSYMTPDQQMVWLFKYYGEKIGIK